MNKRAFTLIEMVVALVLGTLLMAAITHVMQRCFADIRFSMNEDPRFARVSMMVEQLRHDITNARQIRVGDNRFELIGFIHREPNTLTPTHRQARVQYAVRTDGKNTLLVRTQTVDAANEALSESFSEPVFIGVASMLVSSDQVGGLTELDLMGLNADDRNRRIANRNAVPTSLRLLMLDRNRNVILHESFSRARQ
jgi:prepilin-type N-terminal cleavage/methylation domain-containing protein